MAHHQPSAGSFRIISRLFYSPIIGLGATVICRFYSHFSWCLRYSGTRVLPAFQTRSTKDQFIGGIRQTQVQKSKEVWSHIMETDLHAFSGMDTSVYRDEAKKYMPPEMKFLFHVGSVASGWNPERFRV
jgi:hypothetical protein